MHRSINPLATLLLPLIRTPSCWIVHRSLLLLFSILGVFAFLVRFSTVHSPFGSAINCTFDSSCLLLLSSFSLYCLHLLYTLHLNYRCRCLRIPERTLGLQSHIQVDSCIRRNGILRMSFFQNQLAQSSQQHIRSGFCSSFCCTFLHKENLTEHRRADTTYYSTFFFLLSMHCTFPLCVA